MGVAVMLDGKCKTQNKKEKKKIKWEFGIPCEIKVGVFVSNYMYFTP